MANMLTILILAAAYGALFLATSAVSARRARVTARRAQTICQLALVTEAGSRQRHPSRPVGPEDNPRWTP